MQRRLSLAGLASICVILLGWRYLAHDGPTIPRGTPLALADAVRDAYDTPPIDYKAMVPGWAYVRHTEPMKRILTFGDEAVPVLIANLDNDTMKWQAIQLLGDLQAEQAVPALVAIIEYNENDELVERNGKMANALVAAKLAKITGHPKGEWYYRNFWSDDVKRQAAEAYTVWAREHIATSHTGGT